LPIDYIAAVTAAAGIGGILWGVYQYRQGQAAKRQEVLFLLVKEFNESENLHYAKQILGYNSVKVKDKNNQDKYHRYSIEQLGQILKNDKEKSFNDPGELDIRDSFDNFIVFLGKIGYSLKVGAIKRHEILFFKYYIDKAKNNDAVERYSKTNEFPLYRILLNEYNKYPKIDKFTKWGRYKNEYSMCLFGQDSRGVQTEGK
jgi:hypothetical protein